MNLSVGWGGEYYFRSLNAKSIDYKSNIPLYFVALFIVAIDCDGHVVIVLLH